MVKPPVPVKQALIVSFPTPPKPTIPEEAKRIRPDVLVITLLDDLNRTIRESHKLLFRMRDYLQSMEAHMEKVPKGVAEFFDSLEVTSQEQTFDTIVRTEKKWFSATIYNSGPDDVQIRANDGLPEETAAMRTARRARYKNLAQGESVDIDFHQPLLRYIYYKLASGSSSANISIVGEW